MRYLEDEERTHRDTQTQREEGQEIARAGRQGLEAMARTAGSCPKQEEAKKHSSQEERTCQHLNFRVLGSRTVEEYISVVLSHPEQMAFCSASPGNRTSQGTSLCWYQLSFRTAGPWGAGEPLPLGSQPSSQCCRLNSNKRMSGKTTEDKNVFRQFSRLLFESSEPYITFQWPCSYLCKHSGPQQK